MGFGFEDHVATVGADSRPFARPVTPWSPFAVDTDPADLTGVPVKNEDIFHAVGIVSNKIGRKTAVTPDSDRRRNKVAVIRVI